MTVQGSPGSYEDVYKHLLAQPAIPSDVGAYAIHHVYPDGSLAQIAHFSSEGKYVSSEKIPAVSRYLFNPTTTKLPLESEYFYLNGYLYLVKKYYYDTGTLRSVEYFSVENHHQCRHNADGPASIFYNKNGTVGDKEYWYSCDESRYLHLGRNLPIPDGPGNVTEFYQNLQMLK